MNDSNHLFEELKKLSDGLIEFISKLDRPQKYASIIFIASDLLTRTFNPAEALGMVELVKDEIKRDDTVVEVVEAVKSSINRYIS